MTRLATWQRGARCYERSWWPVTSQFAPSPLDAVRAGVGTRLLDMACGPGPVALEALGRGCSVAAMDFSCPMARGARRRLARAVVAVADAHHLPCAPSSFDAITVNFGLHHFAEPRAALTQAARALRPGGSVGYTGWALPAENPALEAIDRVFAPITPPEPARDHPLGDPERMRTELAAIGFESGSFALERVRRHWRLPTAEHVYRAELEGGGRKSELLARQPQSARHRIRAAMVEALREFETADGISIPMTAYVVSVRVGGSAG